MKHLQKHILSLSDYKKIEKFIFNKYNFDISGYTVAIARRRIENYLNNYNLKNLDDTLYLISRKKFFEGLLDALVVPTTELFRDFELWLKLNNKYLEKLPQYPKIEICLPDVSTDDELITLLIILFRKKNNQFNIKVTSNFNNFKEKITNYKIHQKKFESSKQNFVNFDPEDNFENYFIKGNINYTLKKNILKNINFVKFDLLKNEFEEKKFDFVLFRNRLLYYKSDVHNNILDKIYTSLKPKGLFVIGIKETLNNWNLKNKFSEADKDLNIFIKKR